MKDITIRVNGQNPDGTLSVSQVGGDGGNPFGGGGQNQSMVPYNPNAGGASTVGGYKARIGNVDVSFASEADYLKADKALREMRQQEMIPSVGGYGGGGGGGGMFGGTGGFIRTGANAADAVGNFLAGRNIRRKVEDVQDALADSRAALSELDALSASGKYPELIPILRRALLAERDATEAHLGAFEDQLTAIDIGAGSGVARVVADLVVDRPSSPMEGAGGGGGGGMGTALAVGGAGLGIGLLLSRDNSSDRRRRR